MPVGNKQDDEFKEHTHLGGAGGANGGGSYGSLSGSTKIPTSSEGGEETRPRNVAMLYCINATAEATTRAVTPTTEVYGTAKAMAHIDFTEVTGTEASPSIVGVYGSTGVVGAGKTAINVFVDFESGLFSDTNYVVNATGTWLKTGDSFLVFENNKKPRTVTRVYLETTSASGVENKLGKIDITVHDNKPVLVSGGSGENRYTKLIR